jgi:RNA polymerase sigma-70 factor, ECF subfamily
MTPEKTDEQLLADFTAGERAALGELARRYERSLLGLARGLLAGRADLACDAVQETWVRVIRFRRQFVGLSSFKTWVYRIAVNQCRTLQAVRPTPADEASSPEPSGESKPDQPLEVADQNHLVRRAVERLEDDKRFVVLLCYHAGLTHEQAAEILELPLGTLKSRLHAALTELRGTLAAEGKP